MGYSLYWVGWREGAYGINYMPSLILLKELEVRKRDGLNIERLMSGTTFGVCHISGLPKLRGRWVLKVYLAVCIV